MNYYAVKVVFELEIQDPPFVANDKLLLKLRSASK